MVNIRKFLQGIGLVPVSATAIDTKGEMEVLSSDGRVYWHDGSVVQKVAGIATTDTLTNKTISGSSNTLSNVATSSLTGQVAVANGGTGAASLTAHGVVIGNGTSAVAVTAAGTSGQPLVSGGASADPSYATLGVAGGGTGAVTLTNHGVVIGQGTSAVAVTAAGTSGQPLLSGGASADPAYGTLAIGAGGTGQTTQQTAINALTGTQSSGKYLRSNGTNATLSTLDAGDVGTGTLAVGNGGTGQTTYTDGQLLIGNTSGNTLTKATLTAGTGITVTNGNGSITIASSASAGYSSTEWASVTLTFGGGSLTSQSSQWRREGDSMHIRGYFLVASAGASPAYISGFPNSKVIDTSKINSSGWTTPLGDWVLWYSGGAAQAVLSSNGPNRAPLLYDGSNTDRVAFDYYGASATGQGVNASTITGAGFGMSFDFLIPISGWTNTN